MPESARHSTQPSESDFHDSQPLDSKKEPSVGDLSKIESEVDTPDSPSQLIGDIDQIEEEAGSDVLGDITLLEEAFAEMEDGADADAENTNEENLAELSEDDSLDDALAADSADNEAEEDIPVLSESVEPPTSLSESQLEMNEVDGDESIPLLDQQATVYEAASQAEQETSEASTPVVESSPDEQANPSNEEIIPLSELEQENFSAAQASDIINPEAEDFSAPASELQSNIGADDLSAQLAQLENELNNEDTEHDASAAPSIAATESVLQTAEQSSEVPASEAISASSAEASSVIGAMESDIIASESTSSIITPEDSEHATVSNIAQQMTKETGFEPSSPATTPEEDEIDVAHDIPLAESSDEAVEHTASNLDALADSSMPEIEMGDLEIDSENITTNSTVSDLSGLESLGSIEEKIAAATGETSLGIHEIPPSVEDSVSESIISDTVSQFAAQLEESEVDISHGDAYKNPSSMFTTIDSDLEDEAEALVTSDSSIQDSTTDEAESAITSQSSIEHSVGIIGQEQANFSLNIPFELHSQLSKKIDELVIDATTSLTNELETQLSSHLESLLGSAVESALPKVVNQMANELRNEVKGQIKQQLPTIINDVLGKTRLQK